MHHQGSVDALTALLLVKIQFFREDPIKVERNRQDRQSAGRGRGRGSAPRPMIQGEAFFAGNQSSVAPQKSMVIAPIAPEKPVIKLEASSSSASIDVAIKRYLHICSRWEIP